MTFLLSLICAVREGESSRVRLHDQVSLDIAGEQTEDESLVWPCATPDLWSMMRREFKCKDVTECPNLGWPSTKDESHVKFFAVTEL